MNTCENTQISVLLAQIKNFCVYYKQFNARRVEYWYKHGIYFKVERCLDYKEKEVE